MPHPGRHLRNEALPASCGEPHMVLLACSLGASCAAGSGHGSLLCCSLVSFKDDRNNRSSICCPAPPAGGAGGGAAAAEGAGAAGASAAQGGGSRQGNPARASAAIHGHQVRGQGHHVKARCKWVTKRKMGQGPTALAVHDHQVQCAGWLQLTELPVQDTASLLLTCCLSTV